MIYLEGKNKDHPMHGPNREVGQSYAKNSIKEERSLSLGRHLNQVHCLMPEIGAHVAVLIKALP